MTTDSTITRSIGSVLAMFPEGTTAGDASRERLAAELVAAALELGSQSGVGSTMRNAAEKLRTWQDEDALRWVRTSPVDVGVDRAAFDSRYPGSRDRLLQQSRIVVGYITDCVYLPPTTGKR